MTLKTLSGKLRHKNCNKYRINWEKQEKSKFQTSVKGFLEPYIKNHIVYSEFPCFGTRLRIDIFDATTRVAYEISGRQHQEFVSFFHNGNPLEYLNQVKRDIIKEKFCQINNIKLVEIFEEDLPLTKEWFVKKYSVYL